MLKERLGQDLKTALLAGDKTTASVLRSLKSAILYAEVARGVKDGEGLKDPEIVDVLIAEAKKRQESADIFAANSQDDRAQAELQERSVIERYLPPLVSKDELTLLVEEGVEKLDASGMKDIGKVMNFVKQRSPGRIDGAILAQLIKERLQSQ